MNFVNKFQSKYVNYEVVNMLKFAHLQFLKGLSGKKYKYR